MAFLIEKPEEVSKDHYLLKIDINKNQSQPGQFANIKIGEDPLLRRPFSIFDHNGNIIEIIFKVVGKGTKILKDINKSDYIDVIAPLGTGFSIPDNKKVFLIGGGVGNAPLYYLTKKLKAEKNKIHYLYASKSKEYIYNLSKYKSISDNLHICTDDGSAGVKGLAGNAAKEILEKNTFDIIYTCGPIPMMKNIVELSASFNTPVEVSMENYFGCGIGLCYGCTIETITGMLRACKEGPVIDGKIIIWENIE